MTLTITRAMLVALLFSTASIAVGQQPLAQPVVAPAPTHTISHPSNHLFQETTQPVTQSLGDSTE